MNIRTHEHTHTYLVTAVFQKSSLLIVGLIKVKLVTSNGNIDSNSNSNSSSNSNSNNTIFVNPLLNSAHLPVEAFADDLTIL